LGLFATVILEFHQLLLERHQSDLQVHRFALLGDFVEHAKVVLNVL